MIYYNELGAKNNADLNFGKPYRQCSISLMDTIADPNISFDTDGVCNYYHEYKEMEASEVFSGEIGEEKLKNLVDEIKKAGQGKKYDCITGVSGGVDSTYLAYQAHKLGLRPLIVHFDNGWNSELAVKNIENIIQKLGFDLYTLVVDWDEFKDIQLAYLKASVVDIEAITDHAIIGTLYKLANQYGIKYILSGNNVVTEATLPKHWIWNKTDHRNIKDIHKKFGSIPLKTYPFFSTKEKQYYSKVKHISIVYPLNLLPYKKNVVKDVIKKELNWVDYGGKHYESVFTRFYQGYILPVKFGIDKRKAHLSNLIFSGQISKEEAIIALEEPIYPAQLLQSDYEFVLKKFELTDVQFDQIMNAPRIEHNFYDYEKSIWERYPLIRPFRPLWKLANAITN